MFVIIRNNSIEKCIFGQVALSLTGRFLLSNHTYICPWNKGENHSDLYSDEDEDGDCKVYTTLYTILFNYFNDLLQEESFEEYNKYTDYFDGQRAADRYFSIKGIGL